MKLLIDDADVKNIARLTEYYGVDGVTTNPSILGRAGRRPYEVLSEIRALIGEDRELHVQAVADSAEGMLDDARRIVSELGKGVYIKLPAVPEGYKTMKILHQAGLRVTATIIYTPMQAYLAAQAGADYVAPYINRVDDLGYDGIQLVAQIRELFDRADIQTRILAASFKNARQLLDAALSGADALTVPPALMGAMAVNPAVTAAANDFTEKFEALCGPGSTMADC